MSIKSMMENSYGDKFLSSLAQVIRQLEEIITAKDEKKAEKCSECSKELYTRKISRGGNEGTETNEIAYQGRKICVDCHHKLVRKENQQNNQGDQKQCLYCQKYFSELIENKAC